MISKATASFWRLFRQLPPDVQKLAVEKYRLWRGDPFHPSLHFKDVGNGIWSVRFSISYRALARRRDELIVWFWIGTHEEYDRLLS